MTVKQLTECLKHCPEDGEVLIYGPYKSLELASPSLEVDITVHKLKGKVWVLLATEELPQIADGRN
jgi:hypothetical protein